MAKKLRTIGREEAKPLILSKRLTPAYLYEPDHATDGSEFLYVDFGPGIGPRFYRLRPEPRQ